MYHLANNDAKYRTAIKQASRPYNTVVGTITLTNGNTVTVDGSVLPTNSLSISNQCVDGGDLMFGGVFMGTLKMSLLTNLGRYDFFGATIELTFKIVVDTVNNEPVYAEVPLGVFTVSDADRPSMNMVSMTADDNMSILDKNIGGLIISGTPWEVFEQIVSETGIELAFDEEDLEDFINYAYAIEVSEANGIKTYREVVKVICQLLGCFAYADRQGKLALKRFSQTADATLTTSDWYSCVPADYTCHYVALSITSMAGTWTKSVDNPNEVGNIMIIDDAPAWDYGSAEAQDTKAQNLFDELQAIDDYTPCDLSMPGDPTFDLGDRLHLITKGEPVDTLIMSIEWKFHQAMDITCEGTNPYLEGSSAITTESARILNQAVERSRLQFLSFTNVDEKVLSPNVDVEICRAEFTPSANTNALFVATILVDVTVADTSETRTESVNVPITVKDAQGQPAVITDLNGNPLTVTGTAQNTYTYSRDGKCPITIWYRFNTQIVPSDANPYYAIENIENGKHIITVSYPITGLQAYEGVTWYVYMKCGAGSVRIEPLSVKATILGQEIIDSTRITGAIEGFSDATFTELEHLGVIEVVDDINVIINENVFINISDDLSLYNISKAELMQSEDSVQAYLESLKLKRITESGIRRITEDGKARVSE